MHVRFHEEAFREAEEAQAWYEERSLLAAAGFQHQLAQALRRVAQSPQLYPTAPHGTRRIILDRYPFNVFFRASDSDIVVIAVAHQKRRPGYWADR